MCSYRNIIKARVNIGNIIIPCNNKLKIKPKGRKFNSPLTHMISIQDKILKFEKIIYNKQLDDFIPIDDQFIGGGITMASLIKENSFIVEQIKKIKNVFINYCKLNQTVYEKITAHQLALHSESNKINNIANTIDRKLNDSVRQVKEMYEEMQYQNLKTKNLVDQAVKPIEEAIRLKVDQSSFSKQMKKILQQLDNQNQEPDGSADPNSLQSQDVNLKRKKGKPVYYQEFITQKQKNVKLLLELSEKIELVEYKNLESQNLTYKNTSNISKLIQTVSENQNQLFKTNKEMKQVRTLINVTEQNLVKQISNKTSDSVWERKLSAFQTSKLAPQFQNLSAEINKNQKQNIDKFYLLQPRLQIINNSIAILNQKTTRHQQRIKQNSNNLQQLSESTTSQIANIDQKIKSLYNENKVKIQKVQETIQSEILTRKQEISSLDETIKELAKVIQEKVALGVKKNIELKIHEIDGSIHRLTVNTNYMQEQIGKQKGEIYNIKQILSKKANFTDILIHFQRKADKEDFKQLKDIIETSPSYLKSTILDSPQKTRRTISSNSRRRSNHGKNLINPVNVTNYDKQSLQSENDGSSRLFIMGLQNDMPFQNDKRRMSYTESTRRRKTMKQKAGLLNGFI